MPTQNVIIVGVATWADPAPPTDPDAHPEHPIVIPPPDLGLHPEHPIVLPDPPKPPTDGGGIPTHPIFLPPVPTHPIVLPPEGEKPPDTGAHPEHPIVLPQPPVYPAHPIYIPDPAPPEDKYRWVFSPYYGWVILPPSNVARPKDTAPTGRRK